MTAPISAEADTALQLIMRDISENVRDWQFCQVIYAQGSWRVALVRVAFECDEGSEILSAEATTITGAFANLITFAHSEGLYKTPNLTIGDQPK